MKQAFKQAFKPKKHVHCEFHVTNYKKSPASESKSGKKMTFNHFPWLNCWRNWMHRQMDWQIQRLRNGWYNMDQTRLKRKNEYVSEISILFLGSDTLNDWSSSNPFGSSSALAWLFHYSGFASGKCLGWLWKEHEVGNAIVSFKAKLAINARVKRDEKWISPLASELSVISES